MAQITILAYLGLLLVLAAFWYPTTFIPRQQTVFGWLENDVWNALLMIAAYLGVQRLGGRELTPGARGPL